MPMRGSMPRRSDAMRPSPSTCVADVNPGVTERFTSRPSASFIGVSYSQRAPSCIVNVGLNRQSSVMYASDE